MLQYSVTRKLGRFILNIFDIQSTKTPIFSINATFCEYYSSKFSMEENDEKANVNVKGLRETFITLSSSFPDLNLSLTYTNGYSELHLKESNGKAHSIPIMLIEDTAKQIQEAIFSIKSCLKRYDA